MIKSESAGGIIKVGSLSIPIVSWKFTQDAATREYDEEVKRVLDSQINSFSLEYHADFDGLFLSVDEARRILESAEKHYQHYRRCVRLGKVLRHKKRDHYYVEFRARNRRRR
jgi:hypothetical protein